METNPSSPNEQVRETSFQHVSYFRRFQTIFKVSLTLFWENGTLPMRPREKSPRAL